MSRRLISPPLRATFQNVYEEISRQPNGSTPELETTGGVPFFAKVGIAGDGRAFISLPHSNRIYEEDWGYSANRMGRDGQRIGQYAVPLDEWVRA